MNEEIKPKEKNAENTITDVILEDPQEFVDPDTMVSSEATTDGLPKKKEESKQEIEGKEKKESKQEIEEKENNKEKNKKNKKSASARIAELTAKLRRTERERDEISEQQRNLEQTVFDLEKRFNENQKENKEKIEKTNKPKQEDFASYDEYVEALTDYKIEQRLSKTEEKEKKLETEPQSTSSFTQKQITEIQQMLGRGAVKFDDFEKITTNPKLTITPPMVDVLLGFEKGEEVLYALGKDAETAKRIAEIGSDRALIAEQLGALEGVIFSEGDEQTSSASDEAKEPVKTAKTTTKTPEPIEPTGSGGPITADPENESMDKYIARRQREEAIRAGIRVN